MIRSTTMAWLTACAIAAGAAAAPVAQAGASTWDTDGLAVIPTRFQGQWVVDRADCARPQDMHNDMVIISARGWLAWEESGYVTRVGQVRGDTHYFRVRNQHGNEAEVDGSIALRLVGGRLRITFRDAGDRAFDEVRTRCRR